MGALLTVYARVVPLAGTVLLAASIWLHGGATLRVVPLSALVLLTIAVRRVHFAVTKYTTMGFLVVTAVGGAIVAGPDTSGLALLLGVIGCDWLLLRKGLHVAWINAGRETLSRVLGSSPNILAYQARESSTDSVYQ